MRRIRKLHVRRTLDLVATIAMAVAAVVMIWRTFAPPDVPTRQAQGSSIEDVTAAELVTTIDDRPQMGDQDTPVVLIEFSDFECPFCKRYSQETFERVDRELVGSGKTRYAFRHLPLEAVHPNALRASQAAECASVQGEFWAMRRYLFDHQSDLHKANWTASAIELRLKEDSFEECLRDEGTIAIVHRDQAEAARLGVKVTPTFFVGQVEQPGIVRLRLKLQGALPFEAFRDAIEQVVQEVTG